MTGEVVVAFVYYLDLSYVRRYNVASVNEKNVVSAKSSFSILNTANGMQLIFAYDLEISKSWANDMQPEKLLWVSQNYKTPAG